MAPIFLQLNLQFRTEWENFIEKSKSLQRMTFSALCEIDRSTCEFKREREAKEEIKNCRKQKLWCPRNTFRAFLYAPLASEADIRKESMRERVTLGMSLQWQRIEATIFQFNLSISLKKCKKALFTSCGICAARVNEWEREKKLFDY